MGSSSPKRKSRSASRSTSRSISKLSKALKSTHLSSRRRSVSKRRSHSRSRSPSRSKTKRKFELLNSNLKKPPVFIADIPYRAAKKAASRGYTDIHLREVDHPLGKVHHFIGSVKILDDPKVSKIKGRDFEINSVAYVVKSGTYNLYATPAPKPKSPKKSK